MTNKLNKDRYSTMTTEEILSKTKSYLSVKSERPTETEQLKKKELCRQKAKAWYEANPEKVKASGKARREDNPEKAKAYAKAWREANSEKVPAKSKVCFEKAKQWGKRNET